MTSPCETFNHTKNKNTEESTKASVETSSLSTPYKPNFKPNFERKKPEKGKGTNLELKEFAKLLQAGHPNEHYQCMGHSPIHLVLNINSLFKQPRIELDESQSSWDKRIRKESISTKIIRSIESIMRIAQRSEIAVLI